MTVRLPRIGESLFEAATIAYDRYGTNRATHVILRALESLGPSLPRIRLFGPPTKPEVTITYPIAVALWVAAIVLDNEAGRLEPVDPRKASRLAYAAGSLAAIFEQVEGGPEVAERARSQARAIWENTQNTDRYFLPSDLCVEAVDA